ncbi:MAG: SH3 domain-containing protein [Clostridiales bacterium]|nr:SH3 domain-containing protein [Clostridiales bacterium]
MKKCPVCGVEHSDIVPVCSICGSPLTDVVPIPDSASAPAENGVTLSETQAAAPKADIPATGSAPKPEVSADEKPADVSMADVQAVVSSVVSSAVSSEADGSGDKAAEDDEPFDEDSPFVVNAMRDPSAKKTEPAPTAGTRPAARASAARKNTARRPRQRAAASGNTGTQQKKPAASGEAQTKAVGVDTTVIAAASAQKVYEAKHNAEATRAAQEKNKPEQTAQEGEFNWSERKHTREKAKSSTPVIAAVCALLALLIIAMVVFLSSMLTGEDNSDQANGNDTSLTDEENSDSDATAGDDTDADYVIPEEDDGTDDVTDETDDITDETVDTTDETGDTTDETGETTDETVDTTDETDETGETAEETVATADETAGDAAEEADDATMEETDDTTAAELPAITEVNETVYATASVYVRDYPSSETGNIINGLSVGQSVTRTGTTDTGWSRITLNGAEGYVFSSYLSTTAVSADDDDDDSSSTTTAYTTTGVNMRSEPNGTVIATLGSGQAVTLTGVTSGNWTQITVNGLTGYVYSSYLSSSADSSTDNSSTDSSSSDNSSSDDNVSITTTNDTVYATTGVYVRDYPSASTGKVVTTLTKGQSVTRLGTTSSGWSKVTVGGVTGYVYSSYLSTSSSGSSDSTITVGTATVTGYILPYSNSKYYTASELSGLSKSQLRLARNEIYARHGRKFTDSDLQSYFNSCSWYSGTIDAATFDANVSNYLNSYEIANLSLIVELENG